MYAHLFSEFLKHNKGTQHFACHSHYYWPDVSREAMLEYWDDSSKYVDDKWTYFFKEKIPALQKYIAADFCLSRPEQIVFASHTHEFVMRLLSCLDWSKKNTILTTDSEFYSFKRQADRMNEMDNFEVVFTELLPFDSFEERFIDEIKRCNPDMVFISQVFYNSGIQLRSIDNIVKAVDNPQCLILIDGYHAFRAIPTDLSAVEDRIFYTAGSYKYAMGGEGCCFLYVPPDNKLRPFYTGWFAEFSTLSDQKTNEVLYPEDGSRFAGATTDFSSLYRLLSVYRLFEKEGLTLEMIHAYIRKMQSAFLEEVDKYGHPLINRKNLLYDDLDKHGHFYTFRLPDAATVERMAKLLRDFGIITDHRGDRLRFGFALYHKGDYDLSVLNSRRAYFFDNFIFE